MNGQLVFEIFVFCVVMAIANGANEEPECTERVNNIKLSIKRIEDECEVKINLTNGRPQPPSNIAQGKHTAQSSDNYDRSGFSYLAVDGDYTRDYFKGSCTHTENELNAWWQVDLGAQYVVRTVKLYNRKNGSKVRLANFKITVSPDRAQYPTYDQLCVDHQGQLTGPDQAYQLFECNTNPVGRYVAVTLHGKNFLTLCEVEVTGTLVN